MNQTTNLSANPYEGEALSNEAQLPKTDALSSLPETAPPAESTVDFRIDASKGPFFVIFAEDIVTPAVVRLWADLMVHDKNCTPERRALARRISFAMEEWQKHRGLVP